MDARLAKSHFFYALTLKAEGRYDEALKHLNIAAEQYPRDRVVQNQVGRVLFLQRRYQEAIVALQKVLAVDPEDLQAHYNLMLSYKDSTMPIWHHAKRSFTSDSRRMSRHRPSPALIESSIPKTITRDSRFTNTPPSRSKEYTAKVAPGIPAKSYPNRPGFRKNRYSFKRSKTQ
ncbi:MAG: tetratricopeptide repeat protein [Acidobacteria bacterium]|nr:tetratricopeptide repeat protein [Acidobacteriota bacterium]